MKKWILPVIGVPLLIFGGVEAAGYAAIQMLTGIAGGGGGLCADAGTVGRTGTGTTATSSTGPTQAARRPNAAGSVRQQQIINAKAIASVTASLHLSGQATRNTLIAAAGESDILNIGHGDKAGPDSRGLYEQRSSWGTLQQRMDPIYATQSFLLGPQHDGKNHGPGGTGLLAIPNWTFLTPSAAIHAVQINADPNHYTRYIGEAEAVAAAAGIDLTTTGATTLDSTTAAAAVVDSATTTDESTTTTGCPGAHGDVNTDPTGADAGTASSGLAAAAVAKAKSALGTPYVFGGGGYTGPTGGGFDCSSYVSWAYHQASGGKLKIGRTTYAQTAANNTTLKSIPRDQMQAGDLIYIHVSGDAQSGWNHVVMSAGGSQILEEPRPPLGARQMDISEYNSYPQTVRRVVG